LIVDKYFSGGVLKNFYPNPHPDTRADLFGECSERLNITITILVDYDCIVINGIGFKIGENSDSGYRIRISERDGGDYCLIIGVIGLPIGKTHLNA
jgi:hypothetical protein